MNFSTTAPKASALTALRSVRLLDRTGQYACGALGRAPCQGRAFVTSPRELMNNPG